MSQPELRVTLDALSEWTRLLAGEARTLSGAMHTFAEGAMSTFTERMLRPGAGVLRHRPARLVADHSERGYYVTEGASGVTYERALTAPLDSEEDSYSILGVDEAVHAAREYDLPLWRVRNLVFWMDQYRVKVCAHCTQFFAAPDMRYATYNGVDTCSDCYTKAAAAGLLTPCAYCATWCTDTHLVDAINPSGQVVKICRVTCFGFFRCPDCDENFTLGLEGEHAHGRCYKSSCESPVKDFSIPGIGGFRYANGQTYEVSMRGVTDVAPHVRGEVDAILVRFIDRAFPWVGTWGDPSPDLEAINRTNLLISRTRQEVISQVENFTPAEGKGSPAKQLRSRIYRATKGRDDCHTVSLPPEVVSEVGNALATGAMADLRVSITRDLNGDPGEYGNVQSCWWTDYHVSRCAFKTHAGFALLSHDSEGRVTGRSWVIPCEREGRTLHPTFGEPEAFIVFNSYGELAEHRGANTLCVMTGWAKTAPLGFDPENMYVNNEEARVVAPADVLAEVGRFYLPDHLPLHADDQEQAFS